ncbi:MAG: DUF3696 domain-containing protein [Ignavibacteriales bacterium]|nr:DUF3696 domain-containing protein [Ignavibacteriales bacterium]
MNSKSYYGIIDYYDFSRHYFDLKDLTVVNVINEQMQKWLTKFELGSDLKIERENDVVKIMLSTMTGKLVSLSEASSGTLQLLPILFLIIKNINLIKIFSIQQPELHLHPRLHSIFADFIIQILSPSYNEMASINESPYMKFIFSNKKMSDYKVYFPDENLAIGRFNKGDKLYNYTVPTHLIIETHSEHLLKKLQVLVSQGKTLQLWTEGYYSGEDVKLKDALSIYYFAKDKNGNTKAIEMELDDNGFFKNFLPEGFFDEGLDLDRQLLLGRN